MKDVTFIVKSFERPKSLARLIRSIRKFYPKVRIIVADDSSVNVDFSPEYDLIRLPFDVGLSAGRNAALGLVTTPFFLLLDDDFEFTEETKVEKLLEIAKDCGQPHDIVGGAVRQDGKVRRYEGWLMRDKSQPTRLRYLKGTEECESDRTHEVTGMVLNFFLGLTDRVKMIGWDPELKLAEHTDFFWRAAGFEGRNAENEEDLEIVLNVAYCPEVVILHHKDRDPNYLRYRKRAKAFFSQFLTWYGFETSVNFDGIEFKVKKMRR